MLNICAGSRIASKYKLHIIHSAKILNVFLPLNKNKMNTDAIITALFNSNEFNYSNSCAYGYNICNALTHIHELEQCTDNLCVVL